MRSIAVVGVAFAALLGLATTEPAAAWEGAWEDGRNYKGMDIYVCEYDPPGNWEGQYRDNVRPRGCH